MERIPGSERTREKLRALMDGRNEVEDERSELVRLAARLIIEEALEGEARDALGCDYYARGGQPGAGYRNGYRRGGEDAFAEPFAIYRRIYKNIPTHGQWKLRITP